MNFHVQTLSNVSGHVNSRGLGCLYEFSPLLGQLPYSVPFPSVFDDIPARDKESPIHLYLHGSSEPISAKEALGHHGERDGYPFDL